jgi:serine/threonine protein phosphatase PrpC
MLRISGTGESHVGLVRADNQDSAFIGPTCMLVADGVGGGAAGEVASATAAYAVSASALMHAGEDPASVMRNAFVRAQAQVNAGVLAEPARAGMATTLTAVFTDGTTFVLAHLGDSRGYVFRGGELTRVTRDHTYVQDLLDEGRLDEIDAPHHPWRNVVMRTVNGSAGNEPDILALYLEPGDRILLASDGLTDLVDEVVIAETLSRPRSVGEDVTTSPACSRPSSTDLRSAPTGSCSAPSVIPATSSISLRFGRSRPDPLGRNRRTLEHVRARPGTRENGRHGRHRASAPRGFRRRP